MPPIRLLMPEPLGCRRSGGRAERVAAHGALLRVGHVIESGAGRGWGLRGSDTQAAYAQFAPLSPGTPSP